MKITKKRAILLGAVPVMILLVVLLEFAFPGLQTDFGRYSYAECLALLLTVIGIWIANWFFKV